MRSKLFAFLRNNVLGLIAIVIAMSGTAFATTYVVSRNSQIGPNTIAGHRVIAGYKTNIVAGSVNGSDIQSNGLTGTQINEATLGQVPNAVSADTVRGQNLGAGSYDGSLQTNRVNLFLTRQSAGVVCVGIPGIPAGGAATIDASAPGHPHIYLSINQTTVSALGCSTGSYNAVVTTYNDAAVPVLTDEPFHIIMY